MLAGELYDPTDPELVADQDRASRWMERYNAKMSITGIDREGMLRELFGAVGAGTVIRPPLYIDYGAHTVLGERVFINFGCTILDVTPVRIGDRTLIAPQAQILAADHPRDPATRAAGHELGRPVSIGADVWIGAAALILPGVTVGDGAIVGAGAVVTRDVPAGATVVGNPARVVTPRR
ncbi:MAG: sugar O-acetyltransferase [Pseudomonadota bacterium]